MSRNLVTGFVSIFSSKVLRLSLALLITPLLVRILGSELYGDYALILAVIGITEIITNAGIFDALRKYISEDRDLPNWKEDVFRFYLFFAGIIGLIAAVGFVLFAVSGYAQRMLGAEFELYFYLMAVLLCGSQLRTVVRGSLMGLNLEHKSEPLVILEKFLFGVTGLSLAYYGYGVAGVVFGRIIGTFVLVGVGTVYVSRKFDITAMFSKVDASVSRRNLISYNILSLVLVLFVYSLYHVDVMLLRLLAGSQETGIYKAALKVAEFLWFIPISLQTLLLHSVSDLWREGNQAKISELSSKITRYNVLLTALLTIGLASLANDFVTVYYGHEFSASVLPLLILLPGTFGLAIARPIYTIGQAKGDFYKLIVATGSAAVLNLGLNIALIPRYGMRGAAVATSVSYGSMLVFHIIASRRIGFNPLSDIRAPRVGATIAISAPIIYTMAELIRPPYSLLFVPACGFICYVVLALSTGSVDSSELTDFSSQLPMPVSKYTTRLIESIPSI